MKKYSFISLFFLFINLCVNFSHAAPIAKVKELTGKVLTQGASGKTRSLALGDSLSEGDVVQTQEKSAVTIEYPDQSVVTVSPGSKISVEAKVEGAPLVQIGRGNIRVRVAKGMSDKPKFLLKTKSATMGVRGTDFQAVYNEGNKVTSVVAFEGNVAMAKNYAQLRDVESSVSIKPGTFSIVSLAQQLPSTPTKISPAQLNTLKNSDAIKSITAPPVAAPVKDATALSPVPPGIDPKSVMQVDSVAASAPVSQDKSLPPPEGKIDGAKIAPPAGGFLDLQTGLYVAPPPGSSFDPVQQVYVPPASFGGFNEATGAYQPPQGMKLTESGTFVAANQAVPPAGTAGSAPVAGASLFVGAPAGSGQTGFSMTQAPPPPGVTPQMASQMQLPGVGTQMAANMNLSVGSINYGANGSAFFDPVSGQPLFPTYFPGACQVMCGPIGQPGTSNGGSAGTGSATNDSAAPTTTTMTFVIQ